MTDSTQHDIKVTTADTAAGQARLVGPFPTADAATAVITFWRNHTQTRTPAGTTYAVVDHDPDQPHLHPHPPLDPTQLAMLLPDCPTGFPDILDVLIAVHGPDRAVAAHVTASDLLDSWAREGQDGEAADRRMAPVRDAAAAMRAAADLEVIEGDGKDSPAYRITARMAGLFEQALVYADTTPVPVLAWIIKLGEAALECNAEYDDARAELAAALAV